MNRRTRQTLLQNHFWPRKPGALVRIRDSRISARSNRLNQIPLHRAPSPPPLLDQPLATANTAAANCFPFFVATIYGPRCPQRKKLMAAKSVIFLPVSPATDSPDLVIDSLGANFLVAYCGIPADDLLPY